MLQRTEMTISRFFSQETLNMIYSFVFWSPKISESFWLLLPRVCRTLDHWAIDVLPFVIAIIEKFAEREGLLMAEPKNLEPVLKALQPVSCSSVRSCVLGTMPPHVARSHFSIQ